ncbi:type II toxin-antitoxin system death-on-curing family toxin [Microbacterium sp. cx-59]|uniref:type II toxin-antitoxin system death-on-curing family toxin n=1 Tax=Microbacterium sp. cx-59 TaxID=2891207 RepID=UPI001E3026F1|nr:type II toxin-antitoxin system death-on-curing family toxin [Microbacterium sp. cx-59]MCC4909099.1 type II toxin-antitoxin system death-on-curing family toxin [Microbacterium sp. cx-59]
MSSAPVIGLEKLEGAVGRPQASWGGVFLHASIYKQASVLMHAICQAHAFEDGNKRAAWIASITFLRVNGVETIQIPAQQMADYMEEVAIHVHSEEDTAFWLAALDPRNARDI